MKVIAGVCGVLVISSVLAACGSERRAPKSIESRTASARTEVPDTKDARLGAQLAETLIALCPITQRDSQDARNACAERLGKSALLRDSLAEPLLWGGQKRGTTELEDSHTTRFNPLVWRKMYLSLGMFGPSYTIETSGSRTVVRLAMQFRNELDAGAYPYPFWHAKAKWDSYNYTTDLLLFIEDGKMIGALRSQEQDKSRPYSPRHFDGNWVWREDGEEMPSVTLYANLFSKGNPGVPALDKAYRNLEEAMRPYACVSCHAPDNTDDQNPLELFSYPNQALQSRHRLVAILDDNAMPPAGPDGSIGISDPEARAQLLALAKQFEAAADVALAAEGEWTKP